MMTVRQPRHKKFVMARFASLQEKNIGIHKICNKIALYVTYSILGTLRLVIEAASSSLMHRIVGKVKISRLFSAGAGAAFRIEIPLKPRIAANEVLTGVSN